MAMNREEWAKQAGEAYYDYGRQCWIQQGRVLPCGHLNKNAHCYACNHAGETIPDDDSQPALTRAETIRSTDPILYTAEIDALYDRIDQIDADPESIDLAAERAACIARLAELEAAYAQPALPGAETVRETENATPAYDAPFSLTPTASDRRAHQKGLF